MGYDLHIEETEKTLEDWLAYVDRSNSLELVEVATAKNPVTGQTITMGTLNSARAGNGAIFRGRVSEGALSISVSSPGEQTIQLMKVVAQELGGIVVGDEGEEY
ncbi:MAG: hypothetical protein AAFQ62_15955 [Pseudomonadota bacterium]